MEQVLVFFGENLKQVGGDGNMGGNSRRDGTIVGRRQAEIAWIFFSSLTKSERLVFLQPSENQTDFKVINLPEHSSSRELAAEVAKPRRRRSG